MLTSDREGIKEGREWNKHLQSHLPRLLAKALTFLRGLDSMASSFLVYLPLQGDVPAGTFFDAVANVSMEGRKGRTE